MLATSGIDSRDATRTIGLPDRAEPRSLTERDHAAPVP
ncbi:Hypothetical protein A7982_02825 [Minicystis rosea]|nr:Hypothetical protein A7982_02825 [Minicystis rosea]